MNEDQYNEMMSDLERDADYRQWCDERREATMQEIGSMSEEEITRPFGPIPEPPSEFPVFVYGSLKRGFGNHDLLARSKFHGSQTTAEDCYHMNSLGAFPAVTTVSDDCENGYSISGELYTVDSATLRKLDQLEGNGSFYTRQLIRLNSQVIKEAWIYMMNGLDPKNTWDKYLSNRWVETDDDIGCQEWVQR
jgi:gamma-glutamylaminecyclotransferase